MPGYVSPFSASGATTTASRGSYSSPFSAGIGKVAPTPPPPVSDKYQSYFKSLNPDERQNFLDHLNISARAGNQRSKDLFNQLKGSVDQGGSTSVQMAGNKLEHLSDAVGSGIGGFLGGIASNLGGGDIKNASTSSEAELIKNNPNAKQQPNKAPAGVGLSELRDVLLNALQARLLLGGGATTIAKGVSEASLGSKVITGVKVGGKYGGASGAASALTSDQTDGKNPLEIAGNVLHSTATGAGGGAALGTAGSLTGAGLKAARIFSQPISDATKADYARLLTQAGSPEIGRAIRSARTVGEAHAILEGNKTPDGVGYIGPSHAIYDTVPTGKGAAADHIPVPPEELHPGVRNVFAETPAVAEGDTKGAPLNRNYVASIYNGLGADTQRLAKGMSEHDLKLIDQIEIPDRAGNRPPPTAGEAEARVEKIAQQADNPQQFRAVVQSMKMGKDTRYLSDTAGLGRDMGYRQNHLTHVYEHDNAAPTAYTTENPVPGYTKGRVIATKAEAERLSQLKDENGNLLYPHLKLADVNAVEAHVMSMRAAASEHGDEAFRQAIDQAHPGAHVGARVNGQYSKIITPGGVDIAGTYNKRMSPTAEKYPWGIRTAEGNVVAIKDGNVVKALKNNPGSRLVNAATGEDLHSNKVARIVQSAKNDPKQLYDKPNAALKTSVLGGGLFHMMTTAGSVAGQQLVHAVVHPTQIPRVLVGNLRIIASTFSKGAHDANMARWDQKGVTDFARKTGATLGSGEGGLGMDVSRLKVRGISDIHDAIFQRQIPSAKLTIMEQAMQTKFPGMDFHNPTPEQIKWGRDIADGVNNLGGINTAVHGLTPQQMKMLGRVWLAPDYTVGRVRTWFNALNFTKNGPKERLAREMIVGKSIVFALPGMAALTLAGKVNWNDPKDVAGHLIDQFADPSIALGFNSKGTKTNPGGTPQAVHLPTTFISEIGKILKPALDPMSPDKTAGLKSWFTNRVAALPSATAKIYQNKDYYGNAIYGNDASGNSIGPVKTALNIGSQIAPIPGAQAIKQLSGQQGIETSVLNTLGGRVSSDTTSPQGIHSANVSDYFNTIGSGSKLAKQHSAVLKQINAAADANDYAKFKRVVDQWNNVTVPALFSPIRAKNPNYDPKKDQNYTATHISNKFSAFKTRQLHSKESTATLQSLQ